MEINGKFPFLHRNKDTELSAREIPRDEAFEIGDFPVEWATERVVKRDKIPPGSGEGYVHSPLSDIFTKRWGITPIADLWMYRSMERTDPWIRSGLWMQTHLALEKGGEWTCDEPDSKDGKKMIEDINNIFAPVYNKWMSVVRPTMVYNGLCYGFAPTELVFSENLEYKPKVIKFPQKYKTKVQGKQGIYFDNIIAEENKKKLKWDTAVIKTFAEVDRMYDVEPGNLINLKALDPYYLRVLGDAFGNVYGYLQILTVPYKAFTTDKIMWYKYNPNTVAFENAYGTSDLMALIRNSELIEACENNLHIALHQVVKQPAIFGMPKTKGNNMMPVSDPDWNRIVADEQVRVAGDSIMSRGADVQLMGVDGSALSAAIEWLKILREDRMVGLNVPWVLFGMPQASNRSQSEVNLDQFIVKLHGIQQLVNRYETSEIVIPGLIRKGWKRKRIDELNPHYDWNGLAIQDETTNINRAINVFQAGGTTRNEFREELNMSPTDGETGDLFYDELAMGKEGGEENMNPFHHGIEASVSGNSTDFPQFPTLKYEIVCPKCAKRDVTAKRTDVVLCKECGTEMKAYEEPPMEWSPNEKFFDEVLKADWDSEMK